MCHGGLLKKVITRRYRVYRSLPSYGQEAAGCQNSHALIAVAAIAVESCFDFLPHSSTVLKKFSAMNACFVSRRKLIVSSKRQILCTGKYCARRMCASACTSMTL